MRHTLAIKVYYEDTDCLGVVYHANYLKYFERARTELFETHVAPLSELNRRGEIFVVVELKASFRAPGRFGDRITVESDLSVPSPYRAVFRQKALKEPGRETLVTADVEVVCLDRDGNLRELPGSVRGLAT
ncbi:MAG: YbgC/FadM family acyl-CoA thioesterase [Deltaproteobacteria bacterium]|nr:YbgC/FadM family acyl-CoA thioesterase [Deltaproteobacteria bacterium]